MVPLVNVIYNCSNCGYCWEKASQDPDESTKCRRCGNYEQPYAHWPCVIEYYDEEEETEE